MSPVSTPLRNQQAIVHILLLFKKKTHLISPTCLFSIETYFLGDQRTSFSTKLVLSMSVSVSQLFVLTYFVMYKEDQRRSEVQ